MAWPFTARAKALNGIDHSLAGGADQTAYTIEMGGGEGAGGSTIRFINRWPEEREFTQSFSRNFAIKFDESIHQETWK